MIRARAWRAKRGLAMLLAMMLTGLLAATASAAQAAEPAGVAGVGFSQPTSERYQHGVFGTPFEYSALDGPGGRLLLPAPQVFEDRRLLTRRLPGGSAEALTVIADPALGARLALIALPVDAAPSLLAQSEPIGQSQRWRNPIGWGDFDGDGQLEVASVKTPHLGGWLQIHAREGDRLVLRAQASGFSNHRFGSSEQRLAVVIFSVSLGRDVILLPDQARTRLQRVIWQDGQLLTKGSWSDGSAIEALVGEGEQLQVRTAQGSYPLSDADFR